MRNVLFATLFVAASAVPASANVVYTTVGSTYTQDFDSLSNAGTGSAISWTNDSTLTGWYLYRQPANAPVAITTYGSRDGSSNTGEFYSFGTGTDTDRALGSIGSGGSYWGNPSSGSVAGWAAVAVNNATGHTISSFTITYDGEQWRNGGNTSAQTMSWEYGYGATFDAVSAWTSLDSLAFTSPITGSTAGALDGNDAANRTANITETVAGATFGAGETLWIRYLEKNDAGNDHGLAVDNFRFSTAANPVPEPASLMLSALGMAGVAAFVRLRRAA